MAVNRESVTEIGGADRRKIGTSLMLRGGAWQASDQASNSVIIQSVLFFCFPLVWLSLVFSSFLFILHHNKYPLPLIWLPVSSVALFLTSSVFILSVPAPLQQQLLTAHHLRLDQHPLIWHHYVEGLPGLIPVQMIHFSWEGSLFVLE